MDSFFFLLPLLLVVLGALFIGYAVRLHLGDRGAYEANKARRPDRMSDGVVMDKKSGRWIAKPRLSSDAIASTLRRQGEG